MNRVGDLTNPRIASLYAQVPAEQLGKFKAFQNDFPYFDVTIDAVSWSYLTGGVGDPPLLLLTGALTVPDLSWVTISNFAARRQVIVPAYPPVTSMEALADGIAAIVQHEGIKQIYVMGGSYGGFVAQVFVRRHPELVRSLVLSHTQLPYPDTAARLRRPVAILHWMPTAMVRRLMHRTFQAMMPEPNDETACMIAIFNEITKYTLSKKDAIAIFERMIDFSGQPFTPQDLSGWPGKVLLVFGEADPATPIEVRQRMESLYPGCQVHVFQGNGHTTAVTQPEEYLAVIEGFFNLE